MSFRFDSIGARKFAEITSANVGRPFAIVLDGKVLSAPVIREPITGGSGQISGSFTVEETVTLSALLRAGALPAPLTVIEERTVGPDLGGDVIRMGIYTGIAGFAAVVLFMVALYGSWGMIANFALLLHLILTFGVLEHHRRDADLARHRRHHPRHRLRGRRQHPDQRANTRGSEEGAERLRRLGQWLQARLLDHRRRQRDVADRDQPALHVRLRPGTRFCRHHVPRHLPLDVHGGLRHPHTDGERGSPAEDEDDQDRAAGPLLPGEDLDLLHEGALSRHRHVDLPVGCVGRAVHEAGAELRHRLQGRHPGRDHHFAAGRPCSLRSTLERRSASAR